MHLDLTDEETRALLNLLVETIEADRYPFSPRIRVLREILTKFGEMRPKPSPRRGRRSGGTRSGARPARTATALL
jgi:hypothetical protein